MLEDYHGLQKMADTLPENHKLLPVSLENIETEQIIEQFRK